VGLNERQKKDKKERNKLKNGEAKRNEKKKQI